MNILIVFAHPEPKSFNGQLMALTKEHLRSLGHEVVISDLFKDDFKAQADQKDFKDYSHDFFNLQVAQQQSQLEGTVAEDIRCEQERLLWADIIIFQFPLWWYSVPAPLKGYFDRVLTVGFAYGGKTALRGKRVVISSSTGAPQEAWTADKKGTISQVLFPITHGTFSLLGLQVEEPFIAYGAARLRADEKENIFESFKKYLENLVQD